MDRWLEVVREALALKAKYHETAPNGANERELLDDAKAALDLANKLRLTHFDVQHSYCEAMEVTLEFKAISAVGPLSYFINSRPNEDYYRGYRL